MRGMHQTRAREVLMRCDQPTVSVGTDGESVHLSTWVRCGYGCHASDPGVQPPQGRLNWAALWGPAIGRPPFGDAVGPGPDGLAARGAVGL